MLRFIQNAAAATALFTAVTLGCVGDAAAQTDNVRVIVPDVDGGAIVSGCYKSVGSIYGDYDFRFCLKQRGTYSVRGEGVRCRGTLDWTGEGANVSVRLRGTACGNGVAWSTDYMTCAPSLLLGLAGLIEHKDRPFLTGLRCDYSPARGSDEKPIIFLARRTSN